jgi:dsRNA-specific ribonuclease
LFWNHLPSAPKTLGDIYESLMGAVFLDSGFNIQIIRDLVHRTLITPWWSRFEQLMQGEDGLKLEQPMRAFTDLIFNLKCTQSVMNAEILDDGGYHVKITFHGVELSNYCAETKREAKTVASSQAYEYYTNHKDELHDLCKCKENYQNTVELDMIESDNDQEED